MDAVFWAGAAMGIHPPSGDGGYGSGDGGYGSIPTRSVSEGPMDRSEAQSVQAKVSLA